MSYVYMQKQPPRKLSPEEKDSLSRKYKIGKYREWVFDEKRLQEITETYESGHKAGMFKAGVNYVRKNYPEYKHLSDQELIDKEIYKLLWIDIGKRKALKNLEEKEEQEEIDKDLGEFLD